MVYDARLQIINEEQFSVDFEAPEGGFSVMAASGQLLAWAEGASQYPTVNVTSISCSISIGQTLDVTASEDEDAYLE